LTTQLFQFANSNIFLNIFVNIYYILNKNTGATSTIGVTYAIGVIFIFFEYLVFFLQRGHSPLHVAAFNKSIEIAELLVVSEANVNVQDKVI